MYILSLVDLFKIFLSFALGSIIGIEREIHEKPAGMRTHILVSLATTLFTMLSISDSFGDPMLSGNDPTRIASGVLTGMGFIGAGVIISTGGHVRGITTAASLWITTGVGMAVGLGEYPLAILITVLTLLILSVLFSFEKFLNKHFSK
jgi:putative Mg2+ transporter-C (MgtC) family protein